MNTFEFGDRLEREYFIEQVMHAGFRKDSRRCNTYANTYTHTQYPEYHIVLRVGALSVDIYHGGRLLRYLDKEGQAESMLALQ